MVLRFPVLCFQSPVTPSIFANASQLKRVRWAIHFGTLSKPVLDRQLHYYTRIRSVERGICPIAAVCTVLLSWSRDPCHANVLETFVRGHVGTIPGNTPAKFEVRTFSHFRDISI